MESCFLQLANIFSLSNSDCVVPVNHLCSPQFHPHSTHQCFTIFREQNSVLFITEEIHSPHICFYYIISSSLIIRLDTIFTALFLAGFTLKLCSQGWQQSYNSSLEKLCILMAAFHNTCRSNLQLKCFLDDGKLLHSI